MILVWPHTISEEFRRNNPAGISGERLASLAAAEAHYQFAVKFHLVFWPLLIIVGLALDATRKPELFSTIMSLGLIEVLLFCAVLIRLIFTFEKQFVEFGHRPNLLRTIGLTALGFRSVSEMQRLSNVALTRGSKPTK